MLVHGVVQVPSRGTCPDRSLAASLQHRPPAFELGQDDTAGFQSHTFTHQPTRSRSPVITGPKKAGRSKAFSTEELADLYRQRWDVELYFRDLKTTMGIDILRGRTPPMVRKEILMHLIVYNAIRFLMLEAAQHGNLRPRQISFKASMQALRQWEPQISRAGLTRQDHNRLIGLLRNAIADVALLDRRGRSEPRCVKRRPKPYALLTAHRHDMIEIPHRGRHRAKAA
jgi:hypothetical protein